MIDKKLSELIIQERHRLNNDIELIASENYPSQDILDLLGSVFSVKYAEGYPGNRHYAGCAVIDQVETLCIEKAKELFRVNFANVQPWSGSQANAAVYFAVCQPGDRTLSMSLDAGAHLTHGSKFTFSGKYFENHGYDLTNEEIDYAIIERRIYEVKPRLLITGYSAYSRKIDFEKIRKIVDAYNAARGEEQECILWCDMAHFAGFIAAHVWDDIHDPTKWCDILTSTTHKTLRGPRGGLILWNDDRFTKALNQAVFPAIQGGPNEAIVAAKAQCFIEALRPEYKNYIKQVGINTVALVRGIFEVATAEQIRIVSGAVENHLALLDLKGTGINGKIAEDRLTSFNIITNKNMMPGDSAPSKSSGLRIGAASVTTRGFTEDDCVEVGRLIGEILITPEAEINRADIEKRVAALLAKVGDFYKG